MRGATSCLLLVLLPALLAGCLGESIEIALRVREGETRTLTGTRSFDGSIVLDERATLLIDGATLAITQGITLAPGARLDVRSSSVTFGGGRFSHVFLESRGANVTLHDSALTGLDDFITSGNLTATGGRVETNCLNVPTGRVMTTGTAWTFGVGSCGLGFIDFSAPAGLLVLGDVTFGNATIRLPESSPAVRIEGGHVLITNATLDGTHAPAAFDVRDGDLDIVSTSILARDGQRFVSGRDATIRLLDSAYPKNALVPTLSSTARFEVAWTLTVRAVSLPGNLPVGGLNVTLTSAHETGITSQARTDEKGEARLVALQYAYVGDGSSSRSGNPHVARTDDGGKRGATGALVVESPMTVIMPVVSALG